MTGSVYYLFSLYIFRWNNEVSIFVRPGDSSYQTYLKFSLIFVSGFKAPFEQKPGRETWAFVMYFLIINNYISFLIFNYLLPCVSQHRLT